MKYFKHLFVLILCVLPCVAGASVATTAGSNLTAWNGSSGATNSNNNWNSLMNVRGQSGTTGKVKADFGNCNSVILRCAQPKCAACTTMEMAQPVVAGCVNASKECKKHGDELVQFISAQIVASAAEKLQAQELAIKQAEAQAAANNQSSQQLAQMQQQMAQMQRDMQAQNAQQMAQMQSALEEQKALVARAQEEAAAAQQAKIDAESRTAPGVTVAQQAAIEAGISEDVLMRQQISGEILSAVENAEDQLAKLKETMDEVFKYAGCDARGSNCSGPKRVKMFKEKAMQFFEPYDNIADEMEEALETALALGVDISDVIMMLNGACNRWGKYLCSKSQEEVLYVDKDGNLTDQKTKVYMHQVATYDKDSCPPSGGKSVPHDKVRGGHECRIGQAVPPQDDIRCTLIGMISDSKDDTVEYRWLNETDEEDRPIRVGCATASLESISVFGGRKNKKNRTLDLDVLERIILQDAPEYAVSNKYTTGSGGDPEINKVKYCGLTSNGYTRLQNAVFQKRMPDSKVCVTDRDLTKAATGGFIAPDSVSGGCAQIISSAPTEKRCNLYNEWAKDTYDDGDDIVKYVDDGTGVKRCKVVNESYCACVENGVCKKTE